MSDLICREDLIRNMEDAKAICMRMFQFPKNQINVAETVADIMLYNVKRAPTVDAECVIRCKDCQFFSINYCDDYGFKCDEWCGLMDTPTTKDSFCSDGEEKDGEKDE